MNTGDIVLSAFGAELVDEVKALYRESGWTAYLGNDEKLKRAFDNSLCTIGAFRDRRLVGFIRCVGDGEHIVYVQDLIVRKEDRRKGVGERLLKEAMERFADVRMFALFTDSADKAANAFYASVGMRDPEKLGMRAYIR